MSRLTRIPPPAGVGTCGTCRWWQPPVRLADAPHDPDAEGACHHAPPITSHSTAWGPKLHFPPTPEWEWCGAHEPLTTTERLARQEPTP